MWLFQKLGPRTHPGPTENTETPKNGLRRAKIGVNAPHVVQLSGFGPKKNKFESVRSKVCSFHTESARLVLPPVPYENLWTDGSLA